MRIKKRLTISNIFMILIPVMVIFIIATIMNIPFSRAFESKFDKYRENNPNAYSIQRKLNVDLRKINNEDDITKLSVELQKFLSPKGYNLIITSDGKIISSNITDDDKKAISQIGNDIIFKSNSLVLEVKDTSLVKNSFLRDNKIVNIIAINSSYKSESFDIKNEIVTFVGTYIVIVFIISVIVVTLTNAILSSRIYKKLIVPLELLIYGAEQIKSGNLDFEMNYEGDDEFREVCGHFDEMRIRLKNSVDSQIKYEENRKQLVVGISHDLRTPLTAIKGYVEGLIDGIANTKVKQEKYLNTIYMKACDMDILVDRLFLFSKLDTGNFPFKFDFININEYIKNFYSYITDEFYEKDIEFSFENKCEALCKVKIDYQQMNRALLNIVENSVKYKGECKGKIKINIYEKKDYVFLEVSDNGQGVKEEELSNLFVSFYRGDTARTNPNEGSGLGLAIAKNIVEAHGGEIVAYNMGGLTIKITLPKILSA